MSGVKELWIQTNSGLAFDFNNPSANVNVYDVVEALSKICRYTGHTREMYSVCEHSVRVAMRVWQLTSNPRAALLGLCHDAGEAYIGDISAPLKAFIKLKSPELKQQLDMIERDVIWSLVGAIPGDETWWPVVKRADLELLKWESAHLLRGGRRGEWSVLEGVETIDFRPVIKYLESYLESFWKRYWLRAYNDLTAGFAIPSTDYCALVSGEGAQG